MNFWYFMQCRQNLDLHWHGVKVGPGPRDPETRDSGPSSDFKSGIRNPPKV